MASISRYVAFTLCLSLFVSVVRPVAKRKFAIGIGAGMVGTYLLWKAYQWYQRYRVQQRAKEAELIEKVIKEMKERRVPAKEVARQKLAHRAVVSIAPSQSKTMRNADGVPHVSQAKAVLAGKSGCERREQKFFAEASEIKPGSVDGNVFDALSVAIYGVLDTDLALRGAVVAYNKDAYIAARMQEVQTSLRVYIDATFGTIEEYERLISRKGHSGGFVEIAAAAEVLRRPIYVMQREKHESSPSSNQLYFVCAEVFGETFDATKAVYVSYDADRSHYAVIVPRRNSFIKRETKKIALANNKSPVSHKSSSAYKPVDGMYHATALFGALANKTNKQKHETQLFVYEHELQPSRGDGGCLFHTLRALLEGRRGVFEADADARLQLELVNHVIRRYRAGDSLIISALIGGRQEIVDSKGNANLNLYRKRLTVPHALGDAPELIAFVQRYQYPVVVLRRDKKYRKIGNKVLFSLQDVYGSEHIGKRRPLYIAYSGNAHYDQIWPSGQ